MLPREWPPPFSQIKADMPQVAGATHESLLLRVCLSKLQGLRLVGVHLHNRRQADARQAAVLDLSNQPFAMGEGIGLGSLADSSHTCSAGHHVGPTSVLPCRHPFSQETVCGR